MKIIVNPHKLEIVKNPVNEKEINITKCQFEFSEEITNDYVKEAYFTYNGVSYKQIIVNNECDIPYEVLENKGQVELGVVAYLLENDEYIKRYNPSPAYFESWIGSLKGKAENSEPITPSEMEQYEQALQDGLSEVNEKLDDIDQALEDVNTAITETNNLDLDVTKEGKVATVTLTKKDASTKVVTLSDGTNLMFNWQGTSLGIKTDEDADYTYVDLQGVQGETGPMGAPFTIKKTYSSVAEMNADFNNMEVGDYVMITSTVEVEDNAKLYCKGTEQWIFITDFSGATGIQGPVGATPNIQIGTVVSGDNPNVTRTGTNENPILNFTLVKGDKGDTGNTGATGNGISTIAKTSTSGLVDTYTITYTNGNTTTFTVTNGNGIASITKTGTSGSVDTYTITYTNGTTTTFEVTNGQDGEVQQRDFDYYKTISNVLPKVEDEDTEITLNNTGNAPLSIGLKGNTYQDSTNGYNLLNPNVAINNCTVNNDEITITANTTDTYIKGQYVYSDANKFLTLDSGSYYLKTTNSNVRVTLYGNNGNIDTDGTQPKTMSSETNFGGIRIRSVDGTSLQNVSFKIMLSTQNVDYEPYTNGAAPNPEFPMDIHVVSGDNNVIVGNKNLFDKNNAKYIPKISINAETMSFASGRDEVRLYYLPCEPNTTYTFSKTLGTFCRFASSQNIPEVGGAVTVINSDTSSNVATITTGNNDNYLSFYPLLLSEISTIGYNNVIEKAQIEKGLSATDYVEHQEQVYPINLSNIELCKIGDYQDYLYKENNKWYKYGAIGKVVLDGSENWNKSTSYPGNYYCQNGVPNAITFSVNCFSNLTNIFFNSYTQLSNGDNGIMLEGGSANKTIDFKISSISTLADFKTFLGNTNLILYYVYATPTTTEITDSTLISQLDNIEYAMSYKEQTNISQENNDMPFIIPTSAFKDLSSVIGSLTNRITTLEE